MSGSGQTARAWTRTLYVIALLAKARFELEQLGLMNTYRLYFLDKGAHISQPGVVIECVNDDEAIKEARSLADGKDIELWRGTRLVAEIPHR